MRTNLRASLVLYIVAAVLPFGLSAFATSRDKTSPADVERARDQAAELGASRDPSAARSLETLLQYPSDVVRATAATSLGILASPVSVGPLLDRLAIERSSFVRKEIVYALGAIGDRSAVAPLSDRLLREKDKELRSALAIALGQIGDPGSLKALERRLDDKEPFVRREVIIALGRIRARSALLAITRALDQDTDADVRRAAAVALGNIGDPASESALAKAARDPDPYVQQAALGALEALRTPDRNPSQEPHD